MSKRPWMPFYFGDYIADTGHLTTLEHGAYLMLIAHYWQRESLPDDDAQLSRIARVSPKTWRRIKPTLQAFFVDGWKHKRIEFELTESARISAAGRAAGKASAEARKSRKPLTYNDATSTTVDQSSNDRTNDRATIGQPLHSQPQSQEERKKIHADACDDENVPRNTSEPVESPKGQPTKYEFESGVIRLNKTDFEKWQQSFSHLDLRAELLALTQWANEQGPSKWFYSVSGALAKRNREQKNKIETAKKEPYLWRSGIEGVV